MKAAVRVQRLDGVNALGHLPVALAQLRAQRAAGGQHVVVADEPQIPRRVARVELQAPLALERHQQDRLRRVADIGGAKIGRQPAAGREAVLDHALVDGEAALHGIGGRQRQRRAAGGGGQQGQ